MIDFIDTEHITALRSCLMKSAMSLDWKEFHAIRLALSDLLEEEGRLLEAKVTRADWMFLSRKRIYSGATLDFWAVPSPVTRMDSNKSPRFPMLFDTVNRSTLLHFQPCTLKPKRLDKIQEIISFTWMESRMGVHWYDEGAVKNGIWALWE